jgi:hypothetical protein
MRLIRCRYEKSKAFLALFIYGTLCRFQDTANLYWLSLGVAVADIVRNRPQRAMLSLGSIVTWIFFEEINFMEGV